MKYNIIVIGAGQIGCRHIESLIQCELDLDIYILDKSEDVLSSVNERYTLLQKNKRLYTTRYISVLPDYIDVAIISTSADIRFSVLKGLLAEKKVKYLILEKILFQNPADYEKCSNLLVRENVKECWVNCPLRTLPFFKELKQNIVNGGDLYYEAEGKQLGLTCNSIHHIDLFLYLCGTDLLSLNSSQLGDVVESKRKGFYEIVGTLQGSTTGANIKIVSQEDAKSPYTILIRNDLFSCEICPLRNEVTYSPNNKIEMKTPFQNLLQSQLTGIMVRDILQTGTCDLPRYGFSQAIHLLLLDTFNHHFSKKFGRDVSICPIT